MNDTRINDKMKVQEILNEISNLKKYSNELANNISGVKLENLINNLTKNINVLNDETEKIYDQNFLIDKDE